MIKMVITTAGRQALINSSSTGTNAVKIAAIGVGTGRYTATESQTALQAEVKRLNIVEGGSAGDNAFHVAYRDESSSSYSVYEFGLFLDSGILFAVYSTSELLLQKSSSAIAELAVDIALTDVNVSQIQFGNVTYSNPAATTKNAGVMAIATDEEVQGGEAEQKALTPANIKSLTATETRAGLVELATADETKTGTDSTRAVTPATAKAMFDSRLATSAETITGTNTTKAVTPAGLASLTANNTRKGLIETATDAETLTGTDTTRAVTPAGLQAKINAFDKSASTTEKGFIQLASEAEAKAGTDATKAMTPATTQGAIQQYKGSINAATVTPTGATTGRSLSSHFSDDISPRDFGATGSGTSDDTAAFTALEARITGRDIDLGGLTYLVTSRPAANNYYNGFFKVGTQTVKPVYDFYKFGGTSERFINVKRDFSETQRGGAALLAADYVRSGSAAGAVVQAGVWDDVNRYLYTLHTTSGDLGVVNRFSNMKFGAAISNAPSAYTTASAYIGHQGLAIEHRTGGAIKLWSSMAYETAGAGVTSKGTKAVRFNAPTSENQNVDSSVELFNLFPEVSGSNQATTVCISYSGKYLIAKYSVNNTNNYRVRIFKVSDFTAAGDYSNKHIHEFTIELTRDVDGGVEKALQGMACDDRYIYFLASTYGYEKKHSIYIADMFGNVVDEYRDMSVGKEIGVSAGTTYYEPQSLFFMSLNGQPKLVVQIATGDNTGDRLCHLIALNARQSYYFPTGSGTGSYHALAIDEQARVVNANGAANFSVYPSGLSQNYQARAGANQTTMARFSNDASGNSFVMYKSRGTSVGASGSAVAGDIIGQFAFLVDNGNIDYNGTTQGARASYIEGGVFDSSTLTASGTTNVGVRGYLRFYVCSDANSRAGEGIELIDNVLRPLSDNVLGLGTAQRRWKAIYAATDVISTSDESTKQDIAEIPEEVLNAWGNVDFQQFRFIDEVEKEGDAAKLYFGVVAQRIVEAFQAAGIDACKYGLVCRETLEDGSMIYGVRYREALAIEAEFARRQINAVNARVDNVYTKDQVYTKAEIDGVSTGAEVTVKMNEIVGYLKDFEAVTGEDLPLELYAETIDAAQRWQANPNEVKEWRSNSNGSTNPYNPISPKFVVDFNVTIADGVTSYPSFGVGIEWLFAPAAKNLFCATYKSNTIKYIIAPTATTLQAACQETTEARCVYAPNASDVYALFRNALSINAFVYAPKATKWGATFRNNFKFNRAIDMSSADTAGDTFYKTAMSPENIAATLDTLPLKTDGISRPIQFSRNDGTKLAPLMAVSPYKESVDAAVARGWTVQFD